MEVYTMSYMLYAVTDLKKKHFLMQKFHSSFGVRIRIWHRAIALHIMNIITH